MGLFSNLISRLTGNTSKRIEANPDYQSPYTIKERATALPGQQPAVTSQIEAVKAGFKSVISSNVAGISWSPGTIVEGTINPETVNVLGKQGGAPILGGIKTASGELTNLVPTSQIANVQKQKHSIVSRVVAMLFGYSLDDIPPSTLGTLEVMFRNGSIYAYYGVTKRTYDEFYNSSSKGRFVWYRLRGKYAYRRLK